MNKSFDQRTADIFGCLDDLEKKHEQFNEDSKNDKIDIKKFWKPPVDLPDIISHTKSSDTKSDRNQEFVAPKLPPKRHQNNFGGKAGRGRWQPQAGYKHYSLADVDTLNESDNKAAAFAFLREKDEARQAAELELLRTDEPESSGGKILFKKKEHRVTKRLSTSNQSPCKKKTMKLISDEPEINSSETGSKLFSTSFPDTEPEKDSSDSLSHDKPAQPKDISSLTEESFGFRKIKSKNIRRRRDSDEDDGHV